MGMELTQHYRELDDDALLSIAADRKSLTSEAAMALDAELSSRRLGRHRVEEVAEEDRRFERQEARTDTRAGRSLFIRGAFGFEYYGRSNVEKRMEAEIYAATLFLAVLWVPIIPVGTYRLVASLKNWLWRPDPKVVEKLPLNWNQILWIWTKVLVVGALHNRGTPLHQVTRSRLFG